MRSYAKSGDQLTPLQTLPAYDGYPQVIVLDAHRPAVLVRDYNTKEVKMSVQEGAQWTAWRTLARDTQDDLNIFSLCMLGPNSLALFDENSKSVKLYELA